nr:M56 family metallopeptidase [uncultured Dyadobacter sp.]
MNWNIIHQPAFQKLVQALCLTLVHSLWQGLLAAIIAGAVLLSTRKSKPALRYKLLALVMSLFVIGSVSTFGLILNGAGAGPQNTYPMPWGEQSVFSDEADVVTIAMAEITTGSHWIRHAVDFFSLHAQLIVTIWFIVFALKSLQAASGLYYLKKVTRSVSVPEMRWIVRFCELAGRMRVRQEVELLESIQVAVPMVIGFLKPVVLVPMGMLANLPAGQVEAILLHELAHIRRRDYLVNLVQIFCENIFFFNPAILWISGLIREEREHCCDDLAIGVTQNKTSFIHALVSFQEYNQSGSVFEMAFSKKRNHLLDRIKRIVNNNNKPLEAMEKLFVTVSLAAAIVLSAATTPEKPAVTAKVPDQQRRAPLAEVTQQPQIVHAKPDTLPRKKGVVEKTQIHSANVRTAREGISTYHVTRNNREYEIVQRNGKTVSLWVDNREIPESEYGKYQPEIDKLMEEIRIQHERAEKDREKAEEMRKEADIQRRHADKQREEADQQRQVAEKQREEANHQRVLAQKQRDDADQTRVLAEKQREAADDMRKQADQMRLVAEKQRLLAGEQRELAEVQRKKAEEMRKVAEKDREVYMKLQEGLIGELTDAGLVKDTESLSYKLGQDELIVNGVKQPSDFHQKLKAKYLKDLGGKKPEMFYNFKGRTGYSISGMSYDR